MFTRRDVLRGVGSWSAANAARMLAPGLFAAGLTSCCHSKKTLNIILHGLFVMDVSSEGIQLLTPYIPEHIYRAGNWDKDPTQNQQFYPLNGDYRLTGVKAERHIPDMNQDTNLVLSKTKYKFTIDPSSSHVTIHLPLPREIHFVRFLKGASLYKGIEGSGLALCTVLVFEVSNEPRLGNSGWKPYFYSPPNMANLHIWAEPEMRTTPGHAKRAYRELMRFFSGLKTPFEPLYDDTPPLDTEERVLGVPPIQEMGWSEWQSNGEGSRPTNCNAVGTI